MSTVAEQLKPFILDVPDFPKPGIVFKDITPLLAEPSAWRQTIKAMSAEVSKYQPDLLLAIESRGFIFGAAMALEMGIGVHMARKPGKLPRPTKNVTYELEYGQDRLEMHDDLLKFGRRVAIIDDVLATGGTAVAASELVESLGGQVICCSVFIELAALGGRARLAERAVTSVLQY